MDKNAYENWINWDTWAVVLWARNDEYNYNRWLKNGLIYMRKNNTHYKMAEEMKVWVKRDLRFGTENINWNNVCWDSVAATCWDDLLDSGVEV